MLMETLAHVCAFLTANSGEIVQWLHHLADFAGERLPATDVALVGPHTFSQVRLAPFETAGVFVVPRALAHENPARRIAVSVTHLPLYQPGIGLDLRVWSSFPATLDTLTAEFCTHFAQANPVVSSVANLQLFEVPQLACNRWLADQLTADGSSPHRYYYAWLEQYRCLRGDYPADPRRNFRAAVSAWVRARARRNPPA